MKNYLLLINSANKNLNCVINIYTIYILLDYLVIGYNLRCIIAFMMITHLIGKSLGI